METDEELCKEASMLASLSKVNSTMRWPKLRLSQRRKSVNTSKIRVRDWLTLSAIFCNDSTERNKRQIKSTLFHVFQTLKRRFWSRGQRKRSFLLRHLLPHQGLHRWLPSPPLRLHTHHRGCHSSYLAVYSLHLTLFLPRSSSSSICLLTS